MFQASVKQLKKTLSDDTLFPTGTRLDVQYEKTDDAGRNGYIGRFELSVHRKVLLRGEYVGKKSAVNENICEDVVLQLMSRGLFLLHKVRENDDASKGTP